MSLFPTETSLGITYPLYSGTLGFILFSRHWFPWVWWQYHSFTCLIGTMNQCARIIVHVKKDLPPWLIILSPFLFPPRKIREDRKEKEVSKTDFNHFSVDQKIFILPLY